jgi:hypothetical protein
MRPSLIHGMMLAALAVAGWPRGADAHGHFRSRYETVYAAPVETVYVAPVATVLVEPTTYVVPTEYVVRSAPLVPTSYLVAGPRRPGLFGALLPTRYYRVTETAYALPTRYIATSLTTFDLPIVETSAKLCCDLPRVTTTSASCCGTEEVVREGEIRYESSAPVVRKAAPVESSESRSGEITSTPQSQSPPARDPVRPERGQDVDVPAAEEPGMPKEGLDGGRNTATPKSDAATGSNAAASPPAGTQPPSAPAAPKAAPAPGAEQPMEDPFKIESLDNIKPTSFRRSARRDTPNEAGAVVEGRVILEGDRSPDAGVSVVMVDANGKQTNRLATTDALGRFALFAPDGTWELTVVDSAGERYYYGDFAVAEGVVRSSNGKVFPNFTLKHK